MKTLLSIVGTCVAIALATSCADLGLGVDVGTSSYTNPYWYPNGYVGDYYWNTPVWNYGPIYKPTPPAPAPPQIIVTPQVTNRPAQTHRPPTVNQNPANGIGWNPGPSERPGNNGLPTGHPAN